MSADGVFNNPSELNGLTVYDKDGEKIGGIGQVYVDDRTGRPEWVTVKTGLFGMKESLIPLSGARSMGDDLHVPYAKETVKNAPRLDADEHLDPGQEQELYRHYGLTGAGMGMGTGTAAGTQTPSGPGTTAPAAGRAGTSDDTAADSGAGAGAGTGAGAGATGNAAYATRGSQEMSTDKGADELIRSEEEMYVGTEEHEVGAARLHKVVVTETVTKTVPVIHEEVRVVREPIKPGDRGAMNTRIGEAEAEVVLHAEETVIRKETIPVERVRLEREKVTEQKEVSSDVRKERIEYDSGQDDKGGRGGKGPDDMDIGGRRGPSH